MPEQPHRERWPDPAEVLLAALGRGTRLGERDAEHPDALTVRLGTADPGGGLEGHSDQGPLVVSLRQAGSISVYRDMWEAFAAWCVGQSPAVTLDSLGLEDLQAFQAARFGRKTSDLSLTPRYALRLMRLIDRVLRHHAAQTDSVPNTAAADWISVNPEVRFADAAHSDPLPE